MAFLLSFLSPAVSNPLSPCRRELMTATVRRWKDTNEGREERDVNGWSCSLCPSSWSNRSLTIPHSLIPFSLCVLH